jgi:Predicted integral membrane protein
MYALIIIAVIIHVLSAVFLVGSSIFVWIVVWPASYTMSDEKLRTRFMSVMGKKFAFYTNLSVLFLTITGIYMVYSVRPVYITNFYGAISQTWGQILTIKIVTVASMYALMYGNNIWHGKLIPRLAENGNFEKLKQVRKIAHLLSFITVFLMVLIVIEAVFLAGVFW